MIKKSASKRTASQNVVKKAAKKKAAGLPVRSVKSPYKESRIPGLKEAVAATQATLPNWFWSL
jgi:hypothetical protein